MLAPASQRDMSADEWVMELQRRIDERGFPGARIFVRPPRIRGLRTSSSGESIDVTIQGEDLAELNRLAASVITLLDGVPGLENLQPSTEEASPMLTVRLDRERAAALGLNVAAVGQTLRTALGGHVATRYTEGNREYDVRVILPRERFTSSEDLETIALFPGAGGGAPIYLRDVATVNSGLGPTSILREQQNRILRVSGDVLTDVAPVGAISDSIQARLAGFQLPEGYGIVLGGEAEAIRENNRQLLIVILLAIFLVFVVMAIQYESLTDPLVILLAIPLSLIGVGLGLWITGTPQSAPVLLGVILLAGIVVNNAILLVEYANQNRASARDVAGGRRRRGGRGAAATDPDDDADHRVRHASARARPRRGLGAHATARDRGRVGDDAVDGPDTDRRARRLRGDEPVRGASQGMDRRAAPGRRRRGAGSGRQASGACDCPPLAGSRPFEESAVVATR